jgi:hypothetical protein
MKWIGLLAALLLVICCFTPWIVIESKKIVVSGIDAAGTNYGKPGYLHFVLAGLFLIFSFITKVWAKRINLLVVAVNLAWAIRNYFVVTACAAGECPDTQLGLWLMLLSSLLLLLSSLFPDIKLPASNKQ